MFLMHVLYHGQRMMSMKRKAALTLRLLFCRSKIRSIGDRDTVNRKERDIMTKFEEFEQIIAKLRAPGGCPWDREQAHASLKKPCIEEAAEVICGINILDQTGDPENLKEELGDLLMQVVMHARIAEEEGYFTMDDVIQGIIDKMIRRHPHVFGEATVSDSGEVLTKWDEIKKEEKAGKEWTEAYLPAAFDEAKELIDAAAERKGFGKR